MDAAYTCMVTSNTHVHCVHYILSNFTSMPKINIPVVSTHTHKGHKGERKRDDISTKKSNKFQQRQNTKTLLTRNIHTNIYTHSHKHNTAPKP